KVADPAGGAFAVEKLTDDLAVAGWEELGRLESPSSGGGVGGVVAAIEDGSLESRIEDVVAERDRRIATREHALTGLTEFPNLHETLPVRAPYPDDAFLVRPYGEPFEKLRDDPPDEPVFLATMGPIAQHTARASFVTNLLAAGGVSVEVAGHTDGVDSLIRGNDGRSVVCLAGSEAAYAEWGAEAAAALRANGAKWIIIAGKPTDYADDSCAMGVDALDFLHRTREKLA
ncbi:MAG: methylmalonyl-CoA mutase family protein, partial [Marmoricola sp.]